MACHGSSEATCQFCSVSRWQLSCALLGIIKVRIMPPLGYSSKDSRASVWCHGLCTAPEWPNTLQASTELLPADSHALVEKVCIGVAIKALGSVVRPHV
jgi:hypothetical protein